MLDFEIQDSSNNITSYQFGPGVFLMGKGDQCDVLLNDGHVSRVHAELVVKKESAQLVDKGSTNGTWFEGQQLEMPLMLRTGQEVVFGELRFRVKSVPRDEMDLSFGGQDRTNIKSKVVQQSEEIVNLKRRVHSMILEYLDLRKRGNLQDMSAEDLRVEAVKATQEIIRERVDKLPDGIGREELLRQVVAEAVGLGALEPLLDDDDVTEVMVNGPDQIYVEKSGKIQLAESRFTSTQSLLAVIDRIVSPLGRRIDESSPMVDARLSDGSRVNAIIPPLALNGPTITIRKFSKKKLYMNDLFKYGSINKEMAVFLRTCVNHHKNIMISGGTGSGKTTLLNILSNFIGPTERIVTIEDAAELQLNQPHVISLESRPSNAEGKGRVTIRDLVTNSLRMRPDRIVVGECRGGEALDMLQAMNTGHDGSLTTGHANSPADFLSRLEVMVMMAGVDLPSRAIREQISSAVDILVQQNRMADGTRKVTHVMEVLGFDGENIVLKPIFEYHKKGIDEEGKILGFYSASGYVPQFYRELIAQGQKLDTSIFEDAEVKIEGLDQAWE
ncbi:pilus assembly protein TadA [Gammaproteobacteria bacterium 45_16_T64]|nr:pilus assembly protein TadA [Gammaproteobacteria bacterium 45_16_T64]